MSSTLRHPDYLALISRLRLARRRAGLSQSALADQLGRPQSYVSKYETSERRLDVFETLLVCRVLHVPLVDVLPPEFDDVVGLPQQKETR